MITEPTRRNIADELVLRNMSPNGRLDEVAFFSRIFNLNDLPTTDHRVNQFPNMATDLWQHRVRNPMDWPDDWWVTDDRLDLLHVSDETFLRFLAEIVHPIVRPDTAERDTYLEVFNRHLAPEGWEIGVVGQLGEHLIYGGRRLDGVPPAVAGEARELARMLGEDVFHQVRRMEASIPGDPDLAIGTAKEFIETVCRTILQERGIGIPDDDDFPVLVRLTVNSLPIVPAGIDDLARWERTIVRLVNNLSSLGRSLAELRNAFGTGHGRPGTSASILITHGLPCGWQPRLACSCTRFMRGIPCREDPTRVIGPTARVAPSWGGQATNGAEVLLPGVWGAAQAVSAAWRVEYSGAACQGLIDSHS